MCYFNNQSINLSEFTTNGPFDGSKHLTLADIAVDTSVNPSMIRLNRQSVTSFTRDRRSKLVELTRLSAQFPPCYPTFICVDLHQVRCSAGVGDLHSPRATSTPTCAPYWLVQVFKGGTLVTVSGLALQQPRPQLVYRTTSSRSWDAGLARHTRGTFDPHRPRWRTWLNS